MSATFVFVELEDVMAKADQSPIQLGCTLVRCLKSGYRMALSTSQQDKALVGPWLAVNGFPGDFFTYALVRQVTEVHLDHDDLFSAHLDKVRSDAIVEMVVTASPGRAARAMQRGITALLFGNPATSPPGFRPGRHVKEWAEIEEAITLARVQKTEAMKDG